MRTTLTALLALLASPAASQDVSIGPDPSKNGFWVVRDIRQGMSQAAFLQFAKENGLQVTHPFDDELQAVAVDDVEYWLLFCKGRLSYASWNVTENAKMIKSMDERVNRGGFGISTVRVSNTYSDTTGQEIPELEIRLEHPTEPYSVLYLVYSGNTQIVLEDENYDDSNGCSGDVKQAA